MEGIHHSIHPSKKSHKKGRGMKLEKGMGMGTADWDFFYFFIPVQFWINSKLLSADLPNSREGMGYIALNMDDRCPIGISLCLFKLTLLCIWAASGQVP
jgi:hypothetical protein